MPNVLVRESLPFEHMSEMPPTGRAYDFRSPAVGVRPPRDGAVDGIVKTRPAAVRIEFVVRTVQWCIAATAMIDAASRVPVIRTRIRRLRSLVNNDTLFFRLQLSVGHGIFVGFVPLPRKREN